MSNTTVTLVTFDGESYTFQGVTDLEIMPLATVFGTKRPKEGTEEYKNWEKEFVKKFTEPAGLQVVAMFLRCAFPDIPERIVKYTIRRLPDGTEECRPGLDLRVRISAKDFEQIILLIGSELEKVEEKLKRDDKAVTHKIYPKLARTPHLVQETASSNQQISSEEITSVVQEVLRQRQRTNQ